LSLIKANALYFLDVQKVVEVTIQDKKLRSGVHIQKCRYLETSGCTGLCVNLCKLPTQYFFTEELGYI
jgi:hypothetical protein